jgi:prophage regulatory protein
MKTIKRLQTVIEQVGYSRSSVYAKVKSGDFPAPISLGGRAVGWLSTDIDAWIEERVADSRTAAAKGGKHA